MKLLFWFLGTLILLSVALQVATGKNVLASDWKTTNPVVISRAEVPDSAPQDMFACGGQELTIEVQGQGTINKACVFGYTGTIRFARVGLSYYISFPFSDRFHELRGVCASAKCAYSSSSDTFITHSFVNGYRLEVGVYKNFSKQVKRHFDFATMRTYFQFEPAHEPDYTLKMGGVASQGESVALSPNGKYAIIEARSYGFVRLDIETLEARRVIAPGATYGLFNDPYYELAISNDGSKVALAGNRAQTAVYLVDATCGDNPDTALPRFDSSVQACTAVHLEEVSNTPNLFYSFRPRFNDSGSRLGVSVYKRDGSVERVIYGLEVDGAVQYIALGDSFTSGEGEENDRYYKETQNGGNPRCHSSIRSYPYLVGRKWNIETRNVACSGARTYDIANSNKSYSGQSDIFSTLSPTQINQFKENALGNFQSGVLPQISFVSEYQPSIVSVGIGGNDAGLMGKLAACLNIDTCEWVKDPDKLFATANEIRAVYSQIRESLASLKSVSPGTDFVMIGYPQIINTMPGAQCGVVEGTLLNLDERVFIFESIKLLNQTVRSAAFAERVGYIDIEDAFKSNKLCDSSSQPAMNAVRIGDDIAPISFLKNLRVIGAESFHPTPSGHEYVSKSILEARPTTDSLSNCGDCVPNTPPALSNYWMSDRHEDNSMDATYARQVYADISDKSSYKSGDSIAISTEPAVFQPGTQVVAEVHSDPIRLGAVVVAEDGSINTTLELPLNVPPGFHTVHLIGNTKDGTMLDLYKTIMIVDKNAADASVVNTSTNNNQSKLINSITGRDGHLATSARNMDRDTHVMGVGHVAKNSVQQVAGSNITNSERFNLRILLWLVLTGFTGICTSLGLYLVIKKRHRSRDVGG